MCMPPCFYTHSSQKVARDLFELRRYPEAGRSFLRQLPRVSAGERTVPNCWASNTHLLCRYSAVSLQWCCREARQCPGPRDGRVGNSDAFFVSQKWLIMSVWRHNVAQCGALWCLKWPKVALFFQDVAYRHECYCTITQNLRLQLLVLLSELVVLQKTD